MNLVGVQQQSREEKRTLLWRTRRKDFLGSLLVSSLLCCGEEEERGRVFVKIVEGEPHLKLILLEVDGRVGIMESSAAAEAASDSMAMAGVALAVVAVIVGSAFLFLKFKKRGSLDPEKWTSFKLEKKTQVSPNVVKLKFALPSKTAILGLPIGQHVSCRGTDPEGEEVTKPYTPTTLDSDVGFFELVVKVYEKGRMSGYFGKMKEGDYLQCKGPKGRFRYTPNMLREFGMIAGGTGLTPCYQVTRAILENPKDKTNVSLIYANVTFEDILLKDELDRMAIEYPGRFKVYYVLNQPPAGWQGGVGFVSAVMIKEHLPPPAADIQILRCGPPPMNKAIGTHLDNLGYTKEMQFQF